MFGYVRPEKSELLMKEYTRYRAIYCGLCKAISRRYGQAARLFLSYDLTTLALLLLSMSESQGSIRHEGCVLNPIVKKPILYNEPVLDLCAGLTVIMAWYKASDDVHDGKFWRGNAVHLAGLRAYHKAQRQWPYFDQLIRDAMTGIQTYERTVDCRNPDVTEKSRPDAAERITHEAADQFGSLLRSIFIKSFDTCLKTRHKTLQHDKITEAAGLLGYNLGCWIYWIDSIDDYQSDLDQNMWNPLSGCDYASAKILAEKAMKHHELMLDRTAALMPYEQDSGLVANIVLRGLSDARKSVLSGKQLVKI